MEAVFSRLSTSKDVWLIGVDDVIEDACFSMAMPVEAKESASAEAIAIFTTLDVMFLSCRASFKLSLCRILYLH